MSQATQLTLVGGPDPDPDRTFCYVMSDGWRIKGGSSGDVRRRSGELKAIMLCVYGGGEIAERRLLHRWQRCRTPGWREWHNPDAQMLVDVLTWIQPGQANYVAALIALNVLARNLRLDQAA